ncbi:hypothetical protein ACBJ59_36410 [Nonomuraea sp. MTCD27]|uniref:hypothetical protein n=1 Tax=Nonomuraea sp. MTCD27 TaxID=1676747 RepID=UPI0035C14B16
MSSIYRILCVSHDPALDYGEYNTPEEAETAIREGDSSHRQCDLLIGRYSYPLIEVGCPPNTGPQRSGRHRCFTHSLTEWVDVVWLRLLAAAHQADTEQMRALAGERRLAHWSPERLRRLRDELGIDLPEPTDQPGELP